MADRWSNPSGALGVNRFRVWPDKNVDSWDTAEMVANFDKLDAILGIPAAGTQWPPDEGSNGGIYKQIALLQRERAPIGTTILWWRPNGSVPIPGTSQGYVPCVGQTLTAAEHDFAGGGSITLPDTRNVVPLGADSAKAINDPGTAGDLPGNAPGVGGVGGSNALKNLAHTHTVTAHTHGLNNHTHAFPHTHSMAGHVHGMQHDHGGQTGTQNANNPNDDAGVAKGSFFNASKSGHRHNISDSPANTGGPSVSNTGQASPDTTLGPSTTNTESASPATDSQLSASLDTRMKFVGFVMLMKVKHVTSL